MISGLLVASRSLRRSPAFTSAAIVTLALGIGANTTMFSVVNAVLLRPLPGYRTDQLVQISNVDRSGAGFLAPDVYQQLRRQSRTLETVAANQFCQYNLTGMGEPEQLTSPCSTANWFALERAQAMIGRTFLPDEDQHGRDHVVVLDYSYWKRRFAGDSKIIGRSLALNNAPWVVIGVMPAGFKPVGLPTSPIYTPYVVSDNPHGLNVIARMKPGISLEAVQSELNVIASHLARENSQWKHEKLTATRMLEQMTGAQQPLLILLLGAVSFVLLIGCVNVANLMLARSTARQHEIDIRIALGAGPLHIIRFVLAEALVIALAASAAAVVIAYAGLAALRPLTATLPRASELRGC